MNPLAVALALTAAAGAADDALVGVIYSRHAADVSPLIEGRLDSIHVELGERVEQGAVIATLADWSIRHDLEAARATLAMEQADQRRADLALADAETLARRREAVPDAWSEESRIAAQYARDVADAELRAASARVRVARASVAKLEHMLASTNIVAPFEGRIGARYIEPGVALAPGVPIVRLVDPDDLWVRFAVPERELAAATAGRSVAVWTSDGRGPFAGTIRHVGAEIDAASQTLVVEASLAKSADLASSVRPGMGARVHLNP